MKKFTLLAVSALVIPGLALAADMCPTASDAQTNIMKNGATLWGDWAVTSVSGSDVLFDQNPTLTVVVPGKNAKSGEGQSTFTVGCTYSGPSSVPPYVTLSHNNTETYQGVTGTWTDVSGNGWLTCHGTSPEDCEFTTN